MDRSNNLLPVRWIVSLFKDDAHPNWMAIFAIIAASFVQAAMTFTASWYDGTLSLAGIGDGFVEHYGVWAILTTDPIILITVAFGYVRFQSALQELPLDSNTSRSAIKRDRICKPFMRAIGIQERYKFIYAVFVVFGVLCWANNIRQTIDPVSVYGNDVFDAWSYKWGFFANKVNLFISWVIIYPLAGYLLLSMSICLRMILARLVRADLVKPRLTHPDRCFGCAKLGLLNAVLLAPYVLAFVVVFCLLLTHEANYLSVMLPLGSLAIIVIAISFLMIGPISQLVRTAYLHEEEKLTDQSGQYPSKQSAKNRQFEFERLCFSGVSSSPYGRHAAAVINVFRAVPAVLTIIKVAS